MHKHEKSNSEAGLRYRARTYSLMLVKQWQKVNVRVKVTYTIQRYITAGKLLMMPRRCFLTVDQTGVIAAQPIGIMYTPDHPNLLTTTFGLSTLRQTLQQLEYADRHTPDLKLTADVDVKPGIQSLGTADLLL